MQIYSRNYRCELSIIEALKLFFAQIFSYKKYIISSIYSEIKSKYQKETFGMVWSIILPIIPMSLYILLATIKAFKADNNIPHIFYIAIGLITWLLMSELIVATMKSIRKNKTTLLKSNFPFSVIYISSIGEVLFNMSIRMVVLIAIVLYFSIDIKFINVIYTLIAFIPIIMFSFGVGKLLSIIDIYIPDTKRLVDMFLRYGLFLSSVIFPFPTTGTLGELNSFNIFNTFVTSIRELLYYGHITNIENFLICSALGIIIFIIAVFIFIKLEYKVRANL